MGASFSEGSAELWILTTRSLGCQGDSPPASSGKDLEEATVQAELGDIAPGVLSETDSQVRAQVSSALPPTEQDLELAAQRAKEAAAQCAEDIAVAESEEEDRTYFLSGLEMGLLRTIAEKSQAVDAERFEDARRAKEKEERLRKRVQAVKAELAEMAAQRKTLQALQKEAEQRHRSAEAEYRAAARAKVREAKEEEAAAVAAADSVVSSPAPLVLAEPSAAAEETPAKASPAPLEAPPAAAEEAPAAVEADASPMPVESVLPPSEEASRKPALVASAKKRPKTPGSDKAADVPKPPDDDSKAAEKTATESPKEPVKPRPFADVKPSADGREDAPKEDIDAASDAASSGGSVLSFNGTFAASDREVPVASSGSDPAKVPSARTASTSAASTSPAAANDKAAAADKAAAGEKGAAAAAAKKQAMQNTASEKTASKVANEALEVSANSFGNINDHYTVDDEIIGQGNFGEVRRAHVRRTGAARAVKSIPKAKTHTKTGGAKQEVAVMKMIDHPNLVMLYEIFEDDNFLHLVMELCTGGHLLHRITTSETGSLTEPESAQIMQQILRAISYLHGLSICHRDVKAENCLTTKGDMATSCVKVCDFGLSRVFRPREVFTARVGTPTHWAPEVLERKYTKNCDMWACGVLLYHTLCGRLPFSDDNDCEEVREGGKVLFEEPIWEVISEDAKSLTRRLMERDVAQRLGVGAALRENWFDDVLPKREPAVFKNEQLRRLKKFRSMNKLKRAALMMITSMLGEKDVSRGRKLFISLDRDGDGLVTDAEMKYRLSRSKHLKVKDGLLDAIFTEKGVTSKGLRPFTYTEFLGATLSSKYCLREELCSAAFRFFDKNGDGKLTTDELLSAKLLGQMSAAEMAKLIAEVDRNGDNMIDFGEFSKMMKHGETA